MTDRVFQDERSFNVSERKSDVEVYVFDPETSDRNQGEVMVYVSDNAYTNTFLMTAEEATMLKEFLISKGY